MTTIHDKVKAEIEKLLPFTYKPAGEGTYTLTVHTKRPTIDGVVMNVIALVLEDVYGITT